MRTPKGLFPHPSLIESLTQTFRTANPSRGLTCGAWCGFYTDMLPVTLVSPASWLLSPLYVMDMVLRWMGAVKEGFHWVWGRQQPRCCGPPVTSERERRRPLHVHTSLYDSAPTVDPGSGFTGSLCLSVFLSLLSPLSLVFFSFKFQKVFKKSSIQ